MPRPNDPKSVNALHEQAHIRRAHVGPTFAAVRLGEREREVLSVLWAEGSATVQQVSLRLRSSLAYTTVMTTLDRLFKKGLLVREKRDRAFLYTPAITSDDLEHNRASALVHRFFSGSAANNDVLLSCLVNAVQSYDTDLLNQLEEKVRIARQQITTDLIHDGDAE
jgi:predicted transcriptional regulator